MRTESIKIYTFDELSEGAKEKAIYEHIKFELEVMDTSSPYLYIVEEMEKMQTPWFTISEIYQREKESIIETIKINEYEFSVNGLLW